MTKENKLKEYCGYDDLRLVQEIEQDYGSNTCFDYIDSFVGDGKLKYVICFVEPCGDIYSPGFKTWKEGIEWWIEVFKSQPKTMDYVEAGHHLFWRNKPTKKPKDMWKKYKIYDRE